MPVGSEIAWVSGAHTYMTMYAPPAGTAMARKTLKLTSDLVPETSWYKNLRKQMRPSQWDRLRKRIYADQGNVCRICRAADKLNCHEVWKYDDQRHVQKLIGFHAVCSMCHHVAHFGKARILARQGHLDLDAVIEHFMRVNGVSRDVFEAHKAEAFRIWRERSKQEWKTDLGEWASLVAEKTD